MYEVFRGKQRMKYSKTPDPPERIKELQAMGYTVKIDGKIVLKKQISEARK